MKYLLVVLLAFLGNTLLGQEEFKRIDSLLTDINKKKEFNGIVLIGTSDSIVFSKSYGYADLSNKRPIDTETQFYIASISKQFTATAILLLEERKKLKLNQLVKEILIDFPYPKVTIHHLLSNTSGIPGYIDYFAEKWNKRKQANTDDVIYYLINKRPNLNFEPESEFLYSNTNYVVLAKIIEVLSNQSYPSFLENNIFKTCNLNSTYATSKPYFTEYDENVAVGYITEKSNFIRIDSSKKEYIDRVNYLSGIQGDGSIVTTIKDLFTWHQALNSNLILSKESMKKLFAQTKLSGGGKSYYGYGWYTDERIADHTGSWPGYQTRIIRNLDNGMVGISLKNVEVNNWGWIAEFDKLIKE